MTREAMKQALEALESAHPRFGIATERHQQAIDALRAALDAYDQTALELCETCGWKAIIPGDGCLVCARQQIKPVAYADSRIHGWGPREWQGLTEEEMAAIWENKGFYVDIFKAVEAKLKEKNT